MPRAHARASDPHARADRTATRRTPHESPWVVTVPLILLAIPSVVHRLAYDRADAVRRLVQATRSSSREQHAAMAELASEFHGAVPMALHGFTPRRSGSRSPASSTAWYLYLVDPALPARSSDASRALHLLDNKYYFDWFNESLFAGGARAARARPLDGGDAGAHRRPRRQRLARAWSAGSSALIR